MGVLLFDVVDSTVFRQIKFIVESMEPVQR